VLELLLATGNSGKIQELHALLCSLPLELRTPYDLGLDLEIPETGSSYAQNALMKAHAYAQASGLWALADDSGLEVDLLDGAPGLHSARLAGPSSSDRIRRQHLLQLLQPHPRPWRARFRCVVALVHLTKAQITAQGICSGEIIPTERGEHGFGYDPIFLVDGTGKTMAELEMQAKNRLSHRARAIEALLPEACGLLGIGRTKG